jgi:hypothetical protein
VTIPDEHAGRIGTCPKCHGNVLVEAQAGPGADEAERLAPYTASPVAQRRFGILRFLNFLLLFAALLEMGAGIATGAVLLAAVGGLTLALYQIAEAAFETEQNTRQTALLLEELLRRGPK